MIITVSMYFVRCKPEPPISDTYLPPHHHSDNNHHHHTPSDTYGPPDHHHHDREFSFKINSKFKNT